MLFKNISLTGENGECLDDMFVGVKGEFIDYIGREKPSGDYGEEYDGKGKILIPGLYNSHSHAPMTLLRGYGENLPLSRWLNEKIFPFEAEMTGEDVYNGAMLAFAEGLHYGVVSTSEMYYQGEYLGRAVEESSVKSNISLSVICFDSSELYDLPIYKENERLIPLLHNSCGGRLKFDLSIHAEYTSTPLTVRQTAEYAKEKGLGVQLHLSETKTEVEECRERRRGLTPVGYFNSLGVFDSPTTAAHCVWLEDGDFEILRDKGVTAVNCPVSNLKLASGFCNVPKLLESGINVAIGTDSAASNNNLNLFEEMKLFAVLYKGTSLDAGAVTPAQALAAATVCGAKAQGRADCGIIKEGFRADLAVLDANTPSMQPTHNMLNNIVFSSGGAGVALTMVDGRVLYKNGEYTTIDIERVIFNANKSVKRILNEIGR